MRYFFFPYEQKSTFENLRRILKKNDIVIFYFPAIFKEKIKLIQKMGCKALGYISIYKLPVVKELDNQKNFYCGNVSKQEVNCNPFWKSVAVDDINKTDTILTNDNGSFLRPFNNWDYRQGWFAANIQSRFYRLKVLRGIERSLSELKLDGFFMDNVISNPSFKKENEHRIEAIRKSIIQMIYDYIKSINKNNYLFINAGNSVFEKTDLAADYYVAEYFYPNKGLESIISYKNLTINRKLKFLAYHKISGKLPNKKITNYLFEIYNYIIDNKINWSFRITNVNEKKKEDILTMLGDISRNGF